MAEGNIVPIKQDGTENRLMTEENVAPHHRVMAEKKTYHSDCCTWSTGKKQDYCRH